MTAVARGARFHAAFLHELERTHPDLVEETKRISEQRAQQTNAPQVLPRHLYAGLIAANHYDHSAGERVFITVRDATNALLARQDAA